MKKDEPEYPIEKIKLISIGLIKGNVTSPENFNPKLIKGYSVSSSIKFSSIPEEKLVKSAILISVTTDSKTKKGGEAAGEFLYEFIYHVENLEMVSRDSAENGVELQAAFGEMLASITYSTSRGLLISKLQDSPLKGFILPFIDLRTLIIL